MLCAKALNSFLSSQKEAAKSRSSLPAKKRAWQRRSLKLEKKHDAKAETQRTDENLQSAKIQFSNLNGPGSLTHRLFCFSFL